MRLLGSVDAIVAQQSGHDRPTLLDHGPTPVPAELAEHFPDLAGGGGVPPAAQRRGERRADQLGATTTSAPSSPPCIDPADLVRWPMTKVLRDAVGVRISRITDTVEARLADPETARLLQVPLLSPILHYTGVTYDEDGRVVDVARIHYRGDRFSFTVTLEA